MTSIVPINQGAVPAPYSPATERAREYARSASINAQQGLYNHAMPSRLIAKGTWALEEGGGLVLDIFEAEDGRFIVALEPGRIVPKDGQFTILEDQLRWQLDGSNRTLQMAKDGAEGIVHAYFRADRNRPVYWQDS